MSKCERCERLNNLLQKERKQIVVLKDKLGDSRDVAKRRKQVAEDAVKLQTDGLAMAETAVTSLVLNLEHFAFKKDPEQLMSQLRTREGRAKLISSALRSLDRYHLSEKAKWPAPKRRIKSEHSMPRHGKHGS